MSELPPPDLMDNQGRLRRIVIALLVGGAAAALGYYIADSMARPDEMVAAGKTSGSVARASQFVFYVAGFAGIFAWALEITVAAATFVRIALRAGRRVGFRKSADNHAWPRCR